MAESSTRTIFGLLAAGVVGVTAASPAWAEVRAPETEVATESPNAVPAELLLGRSRPTPSAGWRYWPSVLEPRGASELSVALVPPSASAPVPRGPQPLSEPDAAWVASLELPDLPVRIDARVVEYLRFYRDSERGRAMAREWALRSGRFVAAIRARLAAAKLPLDLVWLSLVESGHDPSIRSRAGALGLWQFMPGTARLYGLEVNRWVDERHDPELSTQAAVQFLSDLRERFGSWELAMAAYNMGPGGLGRSIQKYNTNDYWRLSRYEAGIPWETALYVPKIMATALVMNNRQAFGLDDVAPAEPEARDTVTLAAGRTLAEMAQVTGVPLPELLRRNPQLIARRAPPASGGPRAWRVHLPPGKGAVLSAHLAALPSNRAAENAVAAGAVVTGVAGTGVAGAGVAGTGVAGAGVAGAGVAGALAVAAVEDGAALEEAPAVDPLPAVARVVVVPARRFRYTTRRTLFYEVVAGETLAAIAARFRVTPAELLLWNDVDRAARLQPGQVLQLFLPEAQPLTGVRQWTPAEVSVLVAGSPEFYEYFEGRAGRVRVVVAARRGDTLTRIGDRYGLRSGVMERINQRSRREVLTAGEEVVVYVKPWRAAQIGGERVRVPAPAPNAAASSAPAPEAKASVPARSFSSEGAR
ncbi:MAG TPA: transglycosylase SLT domain-containing protein [Polyangiaceae bacterium]